MKKQAKSWLDAAYADLLVIEEISQKEYLTHMVAFHSQQAIEKCFKSILEEKNERIPRTHNIINLSEKIQHHIKIEIEDHIIEQLNDLYIESRYPADLGLLPDGKPSIKIANTFYTYAKKIYKTVRDLL